MTSVLVHARGASYRYPSGRRGVEAVDLDVRSGEVVALLGPNGAGKTTLLRLLSGDLRATDGRVLHGGERPGEGSIQVGFAGDQPVHFPDLSGLGNALFFVRAQGLNAPQARSRVAPLLDAFGLVDEAGALAGQYSFGMKRKLLLAETLAPDLVLVALDEPTLGLDPDSRDALAQALERKAACGSAVILATNDLSFVPLNAHRIVFLHEGRVIADAPPAELLSAVEGSTRFHVTTGGPVDGSLVLPQGVTRVAGGTEEELVLQSGGGTATLPAVCEALLSAGLDVRGIEVREPGLAEVFRRLTGSPLDA